MESRVWQDCGMAVANPLVLGIESSCDETGIAVVRGNELLADVTNSSMAEHARYGGIIPEIAARAHLDAFAPTLQAALTAANVSLTDLDAIAVTAGPGLVGSLTIGAAAAKALAIALDKPLYGVNHVIGHAAVDQLIHGPFPAECVALIVSGGHSSLLLIRNVATDIVELGSTLDDAAGEAFDKVGRLLGLPYPGGPHVDALAQRGDPTAIKFPRGLSAPKYAKTHPYDFSFSGLKTAVARYVETAEADSQHPAWSVEALETPKPTLGGFDGRDSRRIAAQPTTESKKSGTQHPAWSVEALETTKPTPGVLSDALRADIAASFAAAVVDVLTSKAIMACQRHGVDTLVIGGGFSANTQLRELAEQRCAAAGITLRIPPPRFCTDNGAMIAALGSAAVQAGVRPSSLDFGVTSALDLETPVV